jgi:hypothetical protein
VSESERAYWTIIAQVFPVLALAIVLELRTIVTALRQAPGPDGRLETFVKRYSVWLLAASGVAVGWGTLIALAALRQDEPVGGFLTGVVSSTTGIAVAALVLTPVLNALLATESATLFRLRHWSLDFAVMRLRSSRRRRNIRRRLSRQRAQLFERHVEVEDVLRAMEERREELRRTPPSSRRAELGSELDSLYPPALEVAERVRAAWRRAIVLEHNFTIYAREADRAALAARRYYRTRTAAVAAAFDSVDPITGLWSGRPILVAPDASEPVDDGGFFSGPRRELVWPDLDFDAHWIVDASELYRDPDK